MKAIHRTFLVTAVIALLAPFLAGCGREAPVEPQPVVRPVKTLTVGSSGARGPDTFPGRVAASRQVDLSFRVGGPLIELPAREGEFVAEGQLLARIDPRDYRLALDSARAQHENAQADFDRFAALYEKDAVSKAQLDQARARRDVTRASLEDAEAALDDTTLRAPFNARVGARFVENFQDVRLKEPILSLVDVSSVKIEVDLPEDRIARARRPDGRLTARFNSAPGREFDLSVLEVAAQADPRTQTYLVTLIMPQPQGVIVLPGMTASVALETDESDHAAVVVPAVAVFSGPGGDPNVWVVDPADSTVHRRAIDIGDLTGDSEIRVVSGLEPGESIAVTAVTQLQEGMEVRPVDEVRGL
jgi:RND family efflux transporter MFP subunit